MTAASEERREREELGLDLEEERSELPPIPESPVASEADSTEVTSLSVRQRMSAESVEAWLRSLLLQVRSSSTHSSSSQKELLQMVLCISYRIGTV